MNLERFVAVMRPRRSYEAVDLGFLITRRFWGRLLVAWLLPSLPWLILWACLFPTEPYLGLPLFWWAKPLFERPLLFVLSRALFGELPRWREVFSWRALGPGLAGDLTIRRFSPRRSLTMPVTLLEGTRETVGGARRGLIGQDLVGTGLTFGCWLAELSFVLALFFFIDFLLPSGYQGLDGFDFDSDTPWPLSFSLACYAAYYLAATLLEPFYVGGGFLLYLQRRTTLEGWDVELAFRRMLQRRGQIEAERARRASAGLAALLLVALLAAWPGSARAQEAGAAAATGAAAAAEETAAEEEAAGAREEGEEEAAGVPEPPEDVKVVIHEIVTLPDFGGTRDEEKWRFKDSGKKLLEPEEPQLDVPRVKIPWGLLRWPLLLVLVALVSFFLVRAFRDRASFEAGLDGGLKEAEQRRFGLEADPLAPISDVASRARQALEAGRPEEALAWLYRGAFQELTGRGLLPLRRDFTEDDCLRHLRRKAAGRSPQEAAALQPFEQLFQEIAAAWMRVAYGHFSVPKADIARFCVAFDRVYRSPEAAAA